jgi:FAD/FMN-containing dehydrogenase/Fe-S oxidoreductase
VTATAAPVARRGVGSRLQDDLRAVIKGDVWFDQATRAVYATDASNYRQVPIGVVCPLDAADVIAAMRTCAAHDVPVLARGAGTSLAGQAVNEGVILDTSRHMRAILEIDPERRIARVQPGVVLDDLRRETERFGLTFGPDPATHAWCTIGGMIGNNSCGTHALVAGKTVDNIERLSIVTYGGEAFEVAAWDAAERAAIAAEGGARAGIAAALEGLIDQAADAVRGGYPAIPRRISGYNLDELLPERGFHVARALVGTESTCVVVTEATVRLMHIPPIRRLVVLAYPDVIAAADAVPALLAHPLLGLEGFDATLTESMRARPLNVEHLTLLPEGGAWLLAELGGATDAEADAAASAFVAALPVGQVSRRVDDAATQRSLWLVRESGLGATAIRANGAHNLEGWEDGAVPPARLGAYIRAITALWEEFGYSGAWYGHFGQGCVHTRNDFDLRTPDGLRRYRAYVERAADIVVSLGGSLSGEHGDGQSRGELLPRMFGPELMEAFRTFKSIWDPRGRMNPGKVIDAYPLDSNLRHGPDYRASALAAAPSSGGFAFLRDQGSLQVAVERCVGVGRCRRDDAGVMCPSYRVTREERHSTRGRAKLLGEMFQGDATPETWRNQDVREALDLCLSCKGCAVDCPTGVDVATYKAEFLHHHYRRRLRPRAAYALGLIPRWSRIATRMPRLTNGILGAPFLGTLLRRVGGLTTRRPLPRFAPTPWRRSVTAHDRRDRQDATVVVWPDTFTDAFAPDSGDDVVAVLEATGERVAIPSGWACCGRPLYDSGMLDTARQWLRDLVDVLDPWTSQGIPIVVPEPSCLAAFRDELPALLRDDPRALRLASLARSPAEQLLSGGGADRLVNGIAADHEARSLIIHPHCHARASKAAAADVALARRLGYDVTVLDAGCCGLAGSFGFRAEHEGLARRIGEETWLPALRSALATAPTDTPVIIDGFSCATQAMQLETIASEPLITTVRRDFVA